MGASDNYPESLICLLTPIIVSIIIKANRLMRADKKVVKKNEQGYRLYESVRI